MNKTDQPALAEKSLLRRNRWTLIASAVGAVIGLTLAGGGLNHLKPVFNAISEKPGVTSGGKESAPTGDNKNVRLTQPEVLQGLPRITDPSVLLELATAKSGYGRNVDSVVAAYGPSSEELQLIVHVVASKLKNPETNLDRMMTDALGSTPGEITRVDAGPLGGIAQCSTAEGTLGAMSVCAWVGDDSFGKFVWIGASLADAIRDMIAIRGQLESV